MIQNSCLGKKRFAFDMVLAMLEHARELQTVYVRSAELVVAERDFSFIYLAAEHAFWCDPSLAPAAAA
jgi:hypothetical protein